MLKKIKDKLHFRKHFGETGYFVGAISIKMEKRTFELKSLKQHVLDWKNALSKVSQINERKETIEKLLANS